MLKLVIENDEGQKQIVPLEQDELEISIGRKEGSHIRLKEQNVSRQHAILTKNGSEIYIEDYSTYGTRLNGDRLDEAEPLPFGAGDEVTIGDYTLFIEDEDAAGAVVGEALDPKDQPRLVVITSNEAGREYLITKAEIIIGREGDIAIDDREISRHHAKITQLSKLEFQIEDLNSSNGIKVNQRPVPAGTSFRLSSADIIELGKVRFRFCEPGESWFFDPEQFRTEEPPPEGGKNMMMIALIVVILIVAGVAIFLVGKDDSAKKTNNGTSTTGGTTTAVADADARINQLLTQAQSELDKNGTNGADPYFSELVETYESQPEHFSGVSSRAVKMLLTHAQALFDKRDYPGTLTATDYLIGKFPASKGEAKDLSTSAKQEKIFEGYLANISRASVAPYDLSRCIAALKNLREIESDGLEQHSKTIAEEKELEDKVRVCLDGAFENKIDTDLKARRWDKARDTVASFKSESSNYTSKLKTPDEYLAEIKTLEERAKSSSNNNNNNTTTPNTTPSSSKGSKKQAAALASEAEALILSDPGKAVKLYKKSLKLYNSKTVRKQLARTYERAQQPCRAAKEWARVGNKTKAEALNGKHNCN